MFFFSSLVRVVVSFLAVEVSMRLVVCFGEGVWCGPSAVDRRWGGEIASMRSVG